MSLEPSLILTLTMAAVIFSVGLARKSKGAALKPVDLRRAGFYALGLLVLLLTLMSPIDDASEKFVSVHMAQHMLLVLIVAPLLAQSRFDLVLPWAISPEDRQRAARFYGRLRKSTLWRLMASPAVVWFVFVASFVAWHSPGLYRAALRHPALHELEHVTLLLSAICFWSMALQLAAGTRKRRGDHLDSDRRRRHGTSRRVGLSLAACALRSLGLAGGRGRMDDRGPANWRPYHVDSRGLDLSFLYRSYLHQLPWRFVRRLAARKVTARLARRTSHRATRARIALPRLQARARNAGFPLAASVTFTARKRRRH